MHRNEVYGVGVDVLENERIKRLLNNSRFKKKMFTPKEQNYCDKKKHPHIHYAVRFACKEAFLKALGTVRPKGMRWVDLEIIQNGGKPSFQLHCQNVSIDIRDIKISLSHSKEYSVAFCMIFKKGIF